MIKRIIMLALAVVLVFTSVTAHGSTVISDGMAELALAAQRYYNTQIDYCDLTVKMVSDKLYEVSYYAPDGKEVITQLYQTDWGVWNLGDLNVKNTDGTLKYVLGGGTDWEYVFKVYNPVAQSLDFTGGNHGNEVLNYMYMYDGVTGEAFSLGVGESKYVNRLVIEEGTTIRIANLDYLAYAQVVRKYTFVGDRVNLDCKIEFIRDVNMSLSYSAMACINKDFSRYCSFDDKSHVMTSPRGECTSAKLGNVDAMVCTLSGDNPMLTVTVGIYNKEDMTDNFSNNEKTFLWDMTKDYTKLYFSKYSMNGLTTVRAGTIWDFGTYWQVNLK